MYTRFLILLATIPVAQLQTTLKVNAAGELPDGSSANGQGVAAGRDVQGTVEVSVDDSVSRSSVVLSTSGSSSPKSRSPAPPKSQKPAHTILALPVPQKVYVKPKPKCEDLKDDKCYKIHEYKQCGYCILSKYPTKGYGCSYTEEVVLKKKGESKKEYQYETKIVPRCKCDGVYILDKHACPSCDSLLKEILACAGATSKSGEIEIPTSCLKKVGITKKELIKCGYLAEAKPEKAVVKKEKETSKASPKPVIIKKEKVSPKPSSKHVVVKKDGPKVLMVSKPEAASAVASASSIGQDKSSFTTATATATATSTKHH